jgi:DNA-binding NtrC family response regulator
MLGERDILGAMRTFQPPSATPAPPLTHASAPGGPANGDDLLSTAQRSQIDRILKRVGGNKTQAARLLGISRRSLYRWIDRLERESGSTPEG